VAAVVLELAYLLLRGGLPEETANGLHGEFRVGFLVQHAQFVGGLYTRVKSPGYPVN